MKSLITKERKKEYGSNFSEHLIEQYKVYTSSIENVSNRRQKTNEFFLALNTAIIAFVGYVLVKNDLNPDHIIFVLIPIIGTTICYLWLRTIKSYRQLNGKKFEILHKIETELPIELYSEEWKLLKKGEDKKVYAQLTDIEFLIPKFFGIIYIISFLFVLPWSKLAQFFC